MSRPLINVEGLKEVMQSMRDYKNRLPPEMEVMATEATLPILENVAYYPPQPPPKNEKTVYIRGQGTKYLPTGKVYLTSQQYGKTAHQFLRREGKDIVAGVGTPATYSLYLRGDTETSGKYYDRSAYMHKGIWETLVSIVNRLLPNIMLRFNLRVQDFLKRYGK